MQGGCIHIDAKFGGSASVGKDAQIPEISDILCVSSECIQPGSSGSFRAASLRHSA